MTKICSRSKNRLEAEVLRKIMVLWELRLTKKGKKKWYASISP